MTTTIPPSKRRNLRLTLLAHPFELALGSALAINGAAGFAGYPTASIGALPQVPQLLYLVVSTLGGIGVVVGLILNDPPRHLGLGKSLERSSLFLVASSYFALGILIAGNNGIAGLPTGLVTAVVGAACLLRAKAIRKAALIILAALKEAESE